MGYSLEVETIICLREKTVSSEVARKFLEIIYENDNYAIERNCKYIEENMEVKDLISYDFLEINFVWESSYADSLFRGIRYLYNLLRNASSYEYIILYMSGETCDTEYNVLYYSISNDGEIIRFPKTRESVSNFEKYKKKVRKIKSLFPDNKMFVYFDYGIVLNLLTKLITNNIYYVGDCIFDDEEFSEISELDINSDEDTIILVFDKSKLDIKVRDNYYMVAIGFTPDNAEIYNAIIYENHYNDYSPILLATNENKYNPPFELAKCHLEKKNYIPLMFLEKLINKD